MGKGKCILPPSTAESQVPGERYVRLNSKRHQDWLIPQNAVCGILSAGLILIIIGIILLAIGSVLTPWGAVLFVVGVIFVTVCVFLCLHAYCIFSFRDQETQTNDMVQVISKEPDFIPTYAAIEKKPPVSPTKTTPDGSLLRNGRYGGGQVGTFPKKQVTMAPDVERPANERVIPIQYQSPQPTQMTYGQPNRTLPQQHHQQYQPGMHQPGTYQPGTHQTGTYQPGTHQTGTYQSGTHQTGTYQSGMHQTGTFPTATQQQNQNPYGYPLQPQQPTPYSSLSHRSPQQSNIPPPKYPYKTVPSEEDYDNTLDTSPMIGQSQSRQLWRPSSSSRDDEPPEPQPLVYPSEKRPMTFEQTSSSKMSIYDNMYALDKIDD